MSLKILPLIEWRYHATYAENKKKMPPVSLLSLSINDILFHLEIDDVQENKTHVIVVRWALCIIIMLLNVFYDWSHFRLSANPASVTNIIFAFLSTYPNKVVFLHSRRKNRICSLYLKGKDNGFTLTIRYISLGQTVIIIRLPYHCLTSQAMMKNYSQPSVFGQFGML